MSVFVAQAVPAGVSWYQYAQLAGICGLLSIPAELSSTECVCAGRADLTGGIRSIRRKQSQKGRVCQRLGPFWSSTNCDKLSDLGCLAPRPFRSLATAPTTALTTSART